VHRKGLTWWIIYFRVSLLTRFHIFQNDKVKELSQKICDTRVGVSGVKTTIDGMRSTRDAQLQEMSALKNKLREQNQRLLALSQEKARIEARNKINAAQDAAGQEAIKMAFDNKQITLKQLKDKIADLQQQVRYRRFRQNHIKF